MKKRLLDLLRCPDCMGRLDLVIGKRDKAEVEEGSLNCGHCKRSHPIVRSVPRFVESDPYAGNFGLQWNVFSRTQLDSANGTTISRDKFVSITGLTPEQLKDKRVLDVGCGMGRFLEVAASGGAEVIGIDLSRAVDAAFENVGHLPNVHIIQANLFSLPFERATFDFVYSFGVLHSTPSTKRAFLKSCEYLRPAGRIAVWVYHKYWEGSVPPFMRLYRHATSRIPPSWLLRLVKTYVPPALPLVRLPKVGRLLKWPIPVLDYKGLLPLSDDQLREWAILDTFDMLGPKYQFWHSLDEGRAWLREAGLADPEVVEPYVTLRGRRSRADA